jgi:hypothetical protein
MDAMKLRGYMSINGDTVEDLAKVLDLHKVTLYAKINGNKQEFTQGEIKKIAERYSLKPEQVIEIFFS